MFEMRAFPLVCDKLAVLRYSNVAHYHIEVSLYCGALLEDHVAGGIHHAREVQVLHRARAFPLRRALLRLVPHCSGTSATHAQPQSRIYPTAPPHPFHTVAWGACRGCCQHAASSAAQREAANTPQHRPLAWSPGRPAVRALPPPPPFFVIQHCGWTAGGAAARRRVPESRVQLRRPGVLRTISRERSRACTASGRTRRRLQWRARATGVP